MNRFHALLFVFAVTAVTLLPGFETSARAAGEVNVSSGYAETGKPLAVRGYDVVSYFTQGRPTPGVEEFTNVHSGATYRFANEANLKLFKESPDKYLPQYGGYCAYGAYENAKFDGDPMLWKIVAGKLYFNLSPSIQTKWNVDTAQKITKADANWKKIEHKTPAEVN